VQTYAYLKAGMQHAKTMMIKVATVTTTSTAHNENPAVKHIRSVRFNHVNHSTAAVIQKLSLRTQLASFDIAARQNHHKLQTVFFCFFILFSSLSLIFCLVSSCRWNNLYLIIYLISSIYWSKIWGHGNEFKWGRDRDKPDREYGGKDPQKLKLFH